MAYRYTARGMLEISEAKLKDAIKILMEKDIRFERQGNRIRIDHNEKADSPCQHRCEEAFRDLAPLIDKPQAIAEWSELLGESEVGFIDGFVKRDDSENVWSVEEAVPTPEEIVSLLRRRGLAARVSKVFGSKKSGRRTRSFEIQPGSGGPGVRLTVKRRFWDSFDLLSVPDVFQDLCLRYGLTPDVLRSRLHNAKFGIEVRNPALGGISSELLYRNLLELLEEATAGIRTSIG